MSKIFISYRHGHDEQAVRALDRALREAGHGVSGPDIPMGVDAIEYIRREVTDSDACLAVIDKDWLAAKDPLSGARRLDDPDDFVRLEISTALRRGIRVTPVLVDDASMPKAEELPGDIKALANHHHAPLRMATFDEDVKRLLHGLRRDDERDLRMMELREPPDLEFRGERLRDVEMQRNLERDEGFERRRVERADLASLQAEIEALRKLAERAGGSLREADVEKERLTLSGFAPKEARPGSKVLVQAYIHLPPQTEAVRQMARERDPITSRAGSQALGLAAASGDRVRLKLEADKLRIDDADQSFVWRGETLCGTFVVTVPRWSWTRDYALKILVEVNGVPVGRLTFKLGVSAKAAQLADADALPAYEPYRYVFLSYSSSDRPFVQDKAQTLQALGIPHFLDVETLRAGDDWEAKLKEHVRRADLFMLFWSPAAAASKWVEREAAWALELQRASATAEPHIKPYNTIVPPPSPPPALQHLHFESPPHA